MTNITLVEPTDPATNATRTEVRVWYNIVDQYVKRLDYYTETKKTLYSMIWG